MLSLGWLVLFDCEVEAAAGVDVVAETIVKSYIKSDNKRKEGGRRKRTSSRR